MQFSESLASREPMAVISAFAERTRDFLGNVGVLIDIEEPNGSRLAVTRGLEERLAACLSGSLGLGPLARSRNEALCCTDIATDRRFDGTFLREALQQAGFRGLFVFPARAPAGTTRGWACFAVSDSSPLHEQHRQGIAAFAERMALSLEHLWLMQSSENSAARLHAILDSTYDAVVILSNECRIESVNRAVTRIFGYSEHELAGRSLDLLLADSVREQRGVGAHTLRERFALGAVHEVECRKRDGTIAYADLTLGEIDGGRGFTAILRDVTARKSAEARMRDADRLAVIGTLAAGLGHDMNNVLLPVRAHLNAVAAPDRMSASDRTMHVDRIRSGISYLQHLADSLHGLALDPDGDGDGDGIATTELAEWWSSCGPLLSKSLPKSIILESAIPDSLPRVTISPHALTRAVLNLLVNAGEAMPRNQSGHWPKIVVRARAADQGVFLEVSDNGAGMSREVMRRVFDMFFTTKTRGLGTGLGLPLVRRVVERVGGSVEIDSRPGLGTTVRLLLPYAEDDSPKASALVTLKIEDGRAAAIITGFLHARGAEIDCEVGMLDADIAVVDAARLVADDVRRWIAVHPPEHLVVLGAPSAAAREAAEDQSITVIEDASDLAAIERGLDAAFGGV